MIRLLLILLLLPQVLLAQDYDHDGSRVRLTEEAGRIVITYVAPRPGLPDGVRPGSVLFDGQRINGHDIEGMAWMVDGTCGAIDYFVSGFMGEGAFTLTGAAPLRDAATCRIVDNAWDSPASTLRFVPVAAPAPSPAPGPDAVAHRYCVTGVSSDLNMRSGPGTGFGRMGTIPAGACDVEGVWWRRGDWVLVQHGGSLGWASLRYLRAVE